jgi:hypothetical protein
LFVCVFVCLFFLLLVGCTGRRLWRALERVDSQSMLWLVGDESEIGFL